MSLNKKMHNKSLMNFSLKKMIICYGYWAIQSCEFKWLTSKMINFLQRFLEKQLKIYTSSKVTKIWSRLTLNLTLTKLGTEARMGKGKGKIYENFTYVRPGQILFEINKIENQNLNWFFSKVYKQIGVKTKLIKKTY